MKIFAYNLCLQFEFKKSHENFSFPTITYEELMNQLFKGMDFNSQVFYLQAENTETYLNNIFSLQTNDIWRDLPVTVISQFANKSAMEGFLETFIEQFKPKEAAGGLVMNEKNEYLCIFNRGKWSLPKGGVEWREEIPDAAVREVMEETGIKTVEIKHEIAPTFHTFRRRRKWILKTTYWYKMKAPADQDLLPQAEEQIDDVRWVSKDHWLEISKESYPLVREIFEEEFLAGIGSESSLP